MKDSFTSSPIAASGTSPALAQQAQCDDQPTVRAELTERFNILKFLGTSGNSFCFVALDLTTQKPVWLKVLSDDAAVDGVQKELFYLEAAAAAKLSHQNITRTTEAEELGGIHFCTIEQSPDAESLRQLLDIRSWLEVDVAVSITLQVADALNYAHQLGVLHLNLSPANIMIEHDGRVLVTGFGVGAQQDLAWAQADRSARHCPQYMSPEQVQGSYADNRSDLYSLGIVLFEMLTDRVPFESSDAELVKKKHLAQAPHPPQLFRHGISNYLSALVITLLEKNPEWRFRTGAQLQTALSKVAPADLADREEESFPLPEPLSAEGEVQTAELGSLGPQADSGAMAHIMTPAPEDDARDSAANREFFEPPTIVRIERPAFGMPERRPRVEPSPRVAFAREEAGPFSLYVSSSRAQSRRQAIAFVAVMLAILLLISLLGRDQLRGLFTTANAGEQNNLPAALDESHVTAPEPQAVPSEAQQPLNEPGPGTVAVSPPAQEAVIPPRRKYVRRTAGARVRQSARRKYRPKRNVRKPFYLRRSSNR